MALKKTRLKAGLLHRARNGFAAAVHHDRVDLDSFQKYDVAGQAIADVRVRGIHETAAVFDDEGGAAVFLDIRERFEQSGGFGDEVVHIEKN